MPCSPTSFRLHMLRLRLLRLQLFLVRSLAGCVLHETGALNKPHAVPNLQRELPSTGLQQRLAAIA